tara:strand:- start:207 stop:503 length:297 start_codon:yes stop_codon:yes gene_type:complete
MPAFNSSLFKNERKERDNQPDFTGPGQITKADFMAMYDQVIANQYNEDDEGRIKVRVAGWKRQSKSGKAYISLSLSIDDYGVEAKPAAAPSSAEGDLF